MDGGRRRRADAYRRNALASVTTHDLPTATGWWDGSTLELRRGLGLLTQPYDVAAAELAATHATLLELLLTEGALEPGASGVRDKVLAMYRFLSSTPSRLVAVALWDAVGDPRQPNVPGTIDTYPNRRLPLSVPRPEGPQPNTVEQLAGLAAVRQMIGIFQRQGATDTHGGGRAAAGQPFGNRHIC
jgi:4-alpha-glucanotransferase